MKTSFNIGILRLKAKIKSKDMIFIVMYLFVVISPITQAVLRVSDDTGIRVSPYIYPHITSSPYFSTLNLLGSLFLFKEIPFFDQSIYTQLIRCNKKVWFLGTCFYLFALSLCYAFLQLIGSIVFVITHIVWIADWGKLIYSLTLDSVVTAFQVPLVFNNQ